MTLNFISYRSAAGLIVILGEHDRFSSRDTENTIRVRSKSVILHPLFNSTNNDNDIALIELQVDLDLAELRPYITPICAPNPQDQYENENAIIIG